MKNQLSIVVPVTLARRKKNIISRVNYFIDIFKKSNFNLIIGTNSNKLKSIEKNIINHPNIKIIYTSEETKADVNLSKLRNIAIQNTDTDYILFLDIDFHLDINMLAEVFNDYLRNNKNNIQMYPCLYLSKKGTKLLNYNNYTDYINHYFNYSRDLILHLAFPSSIILCDLKSVKAINGFDESFSGHGYEDFDFIFRLLNHKGLIKISKYSLQDETYLAPLLATGFRAEFSAIFIEILKSKFYFLHKYHLKDNKEIYYQARTKNKKIFLNFLESKIESNHTYSYFHLLNLFEKSFNHNDSDNLQTYSALWAEIPGHKLRPKKSFVEKLRYYFKDLKPL